MNHSLDKLVDTAPSVHKASLAASRHLPVSLVDPATRFDSGAHRMCATEAGAEARKDWLQNAARNQLWQDGMISETVPLAHGFQYSQTG